MSNALAMPWGMILHPIIASDTTKEKTNIKILSKKRIIKKTHKCLLLKKKNAQNNFECLLFLTSTILLNIEFAKCQN